MASWKKSVRTPWPSWNSSSTLPPRACSRLVRLAPWGARCGWLPETGRSARLGRAVRFAPPQSRGVRAGPAPLPRWPLGESAHPSARGRSAGAGSLAVRHRGDQPLHPQAAPAYGTVANPSLRSDAQQVEGCLLPGIEDCWHDHPGGFAKAMAVVIGSDQTGQAIQEPVVKAAAPLAAVHQGAHRAGEALLRGQQGAQAQLPAQPPIDVLEMEGFLHDPPAAVHLPRFALTRRAPGSTT
jgi:hypothetical protein